jgi:hypothetical protein
VSEEFARLRAMVSQPETWNLNARDVNALRGVLGAYEALSRRVADLDGALSGLVELVEMDDEFNDVGTDAWVALHVAREALRKP